MQKKNEVLGLAPIEGLHRIEALTVGGVKIDGVYVFHRRDREGKIVKQPLESYTWKTEKSPVKGPRFVLLSSTSSDQRYAESRMTEHPEVFAAGLKRAAKPTLAGLLAEAKVFVQGK